jgi:hypothetical protein
LGARSQSLRILRNHIKIRRVEGTRGWEYLTEPFLRGASTLDYLEEARPERFDGRDVIRENTHVTSGRRQVDLHNVCGGEDRLRRIGVTDSSAVCERASRVKTPTWCGRTRESFILSDTAAYPRRPNTKELGARRATEETRRSAADIFVGWTVRYRATDALLAVQRTSETGAQALVQRRPWKLPSATAQLNTLHVLSNYERGLLSSNSQTHICQSQGYPLDAVFEARVGRAPPG